MLTSIENLLESIREKRQNVTKDDGISNDLKKIKKNNSYIDKEYEEFLKEDILYLTKELIKKDRLKDNDKIIDKSYLDKEVTKFNKSQYYFNTEMEILYDKSKWFNTNENIVIGDEIEIDVKSNTYISYIEKNINFSIKPNNKIINIEDGYEYKFKINTLVDDGIEAILFIISYKDDIKMDVQSIKTNKEISIRFNKDINNIRLAMRFNGKGKVGRPNISIFKRKILDDLNVDEYRELGYDKPLKLKDLRVATICDEFTYQCLKDEVKLITFTPENWKAIFNLEVPHLFFLESAWKGKENSWNKKVATNNNDNLIWLRDIIEWCKKNNIPTVFWNKEDPVHYQAFIKTANLCDYIFTTDEGCVEKYKKDTNNDNVFSMQFFAQPKIHNPIKIIDNKEEKACFAGSYYAKKYLDRQHDMLNLLSITSDYGLVIYDRNYNLDDEQYKFPENFRRFVKGVLAPDEIEKAYKGYKFVVNVNSVIDSPTMFSRRVFEALASGTPVISTYSKGINNTFKDIVIMDKEYEKLKVKFEELINDNETYNKLSLKGMREVYCNHTIKKRLINIAEITGIELEENQNRICVLSHIKNMDEYNRFLESYYGQKYENKFAVIISDLSIEEKKDIKVINSIKEIENIYKYDYMAIFDVSNYYGENYLIDCNIATEYCDCKIIGKNRYFTFVDGIIKESKGESYIYTDSINKGTLFMKYDLIKKYGIEFLYNINDKELNKLTNYGEQIYSIDKYNFIELGNSCSLKIKELVRG